MQLIGLKVLLGISVLIFIGLLMDVFFKRNVVKSVLENFDKRYGERKEEYEKIKLEEGNSDEKSFWNHLDIMIERTNLKEKLPFLTTELYVTTTIILAVFGFIASRYIYEMFVFNIFVSVLMILIMYLILYYISGIAYERVDKQIINFINYMDNFSSTSIDIITIIERTSKYMDGVLKNYLTIFVIEARRGNLKLAFRNLESKIENQRLRQIINNLEIASRHTANYHEILNESRMVLKGYFANKQTRKEIKRKGRTQIIILYLLSSGIFYETTTLTPNLMHDLTHTPVGNALLIFLIILICSSLWLFFKIDRG